MYPVTPRTSFHSPQWNSQTRGERVGKVGFDLDELEQCEDGPAETWGFGGSDDWREIGGEGAEEMMGLLVFWVQGFVKCDIGVLLHFKSG